MKPFIIFQIISTHVISIGVVGRMHIPNDRHMKDTEHAAALRSNAIRGKSDKNRLPKSTKRTQRTNHSHICAWPRTWHHHNHHRSSTHHHKTIIKMIARRRRRGQRRRRRFVLRFTCAHKATYSQTTRYTYSHSIYI